MHEVWVGQVDPAIADEVCMILLQRLDARLARVAPSRNECPLVSVPENLHQGTHLSLQFYISSSASKQLLPFSIIPGLHLPFS